jgi:hypothetical protein
MEGRRNSAGLLDGYMSPVNLQEGQKYYIPTIFTRDPLTGAELEKPIVEFLSYLEKEGCEWSLHELGEVEYIRIPGLTIREMFLGFSQWPPEIYRGFGVFWNLTNPLPSFPVGGILSFLESKSNETGEAPGNTLLRFIVHLPKIDLQGHAFLHTSTAEIEAEVSEKTLLCTGVLRFRVIDSPYPDLVRISLTYPYGCSNFPWLHTDHPSGLTDIRCILCYRELWRMGFIDHTQGDGLRESLRSIIGPDLRP